MNRQKLTTRTERSSLDNDGPDVSEIESLRLLLAQAEGDKQRLQAHIGDLQRQVELGQTELELSHLKALEAQRQASQQQVEDLRREFREQLEEQRAEIRAERKRTDSWVQGMAELASSEKKFFELRIQTLENELHRMQHQDPDVSGLADRQSVAGSVVDSVGTEWEEECGSVVSGEHGCGFGVQGVCGSSVQGGCGKVPDERVHVGGAVGDCVYSTQSVVDRGGESAGSSKGVRNGTSVGRSRSDGDASRGRGNDEGGGVVGVSSAEDQGTTSAGGCQGPLRTHQTQTRLELIKRLTPQNQLSQPPQCLDLPC